MGTISDKLMRIINTKEDIRQALISKGYDVPTSIPFKEYAKMISDLPCIVDSFPDIEGIVARYSALGLTNEQMKENPVWVDKTGNGHDLQMKNFAWGGMSGVGGYNQNFNQYFVGVDESNRTVSDSSMKLVLLESDTKKVIYDRTSHQIGYTYNFYIKVTGIEGRTLNVNAGTLGGTIMSITEDGIYSINATVSDSWGNNMLYLIFPPSSSSNTVTIDQLPLYPGALVFDGVDDYGVCENFPILTKEKGYTVVALRSIIDKNIPGYLLSNSAGSNQGAFIFERTIDSLTASFGKSSPITVNYNNPLTYQTTSKYNQKSISVGELLEGGKSLVVGRNSKEGNLYSNVAIWELVFLDHDATEEELTKIKDYFVKTYPWLFPDQAWTVTGKTNEDEDRATIANITGNGNDLVLSNFGFAEGSGYGLYAYNFNSFNLRDNVVKPTDVKKDSFRMIGTGNSNNVLILLNESDSADWKIRITGMKEGDRCLIGNANKSGEYISVTKDGTYTFQKQYAANATNGIWYNSSQEVDVLVEQIPEYEGYLVTDGVDDKIDSSAFKMGEDFTVVGEWKLLPVSSLSYSGMLKNDNLYLYNNASTGLRVYIRSADARNDMEGLKSLKAICSDGRVYGEDWTEYKLSIGSTIGSQSRLYLGYNNTAYTKMIFKNLGIYNNQILSKEDCIKAYNYLQTLKSK